MKAGIFLKKYLQKLPLLQGMGGQGGFLAGVWAGAMQGISNHQPHHHLLPIVIIIIIIIIIIYNQLSEKSPTMISYHHLQHLNLLHHCDCVHCPRANNENGLQINCMQDKLYKLLFCYDSLDKPYGDKLYRLL